MVSDSVYVCVCVLYTLVHKSKVEMFARCDEVKQNVGECLLDEEVYVYIVSIVVSAVIVELVSKSYHCVRFVRVHTVYGP